MRGRIVPNLTNIHTPLGCEFCSAAKEAPLEQEMATLQSPAQWYFLSSAPGIKESKIHAVVQTHNVICLHIYLGLFPLNNISTWKTCTNISTYIPLLFQGIFPIMWMIYWNLTKNQRAYISCCQQNAPVRAQLAPRAEPQNSPVSIMKRNKENSSYPPHVALHFNNNTSNNNLVNRAEGTAGSIDNITESFLFLIKRISWV